MPIFHLFMPWLGIGRHIMIRRGLGVCQYMGERPSQSVFFVQFGSIKVFFCFGQRFPYNQHSIQTHNFNGKIGLEIYA